MHAIVRYVSKLSCNYKKCQRMRLNRMKFFIYDCLLFSLVCFILSMLYSNIFLYCTSTNTFQSFPPFNNANIDYAFQLPLIVISCLFKCVVLPSHSLTDRTTDIPYYSLPPNRYNLLHPQILASMWGLQQQCYIQKPSSVTQHSHHQPETYIQLEIPRTETPTTTTTTSNTMHSLHLHLLIHLYYSLSLSLSAVVHLAPFYKIIIHYNCVCTIYSTIFIST